VLVIDDASRDETPEVGAQLAASSGAVEFRRHEVNKGHIATYNEGLIGWSRAEYTVLLSADDMLAPGSLSRAVHIMNANDNIGMVYGCTIHFQQETELPKNRTQEWSYTQWSGAEWLERRCRAGHNVITSPEVVVRGTVQRAIGGYRPELPHAGDLEMWLRIAAVSDIAYVRRVPQAFYRVHSASMMRTKYRGSFLDLRQRKAAFDAFFERYQHTIPGGDRLRCLANCVLAREALWDACRAYDHNQLEQAKAVELVEFARTTYPAISSLSEYAALRRRQRLGPVLCNRTQLFVATALVRRTRKWMSQRRWKRRGV
jgi:glycosyltransferase involved in cell wall biosynthesis